MAAARVEADRSITRAAMGVEAHADASEVDRTCRACPPGPSLPCARPWPTPTAGCKKRAQRSTAATTRRRRLSATAANDTLSAATRDLETRLRPPPSAAAESRPSEFARRFRLRGTRNLPQPLAFDEHFRPASQVDAVGAPFDPLRPARRDRPRHRGRRRQTRPPRRARRTNRCPTRRSGRRPAPRSGSGRDPAPPPAANSTFVPLGKHRMAFEGRPDPAELRLGRQRTEDHALRIAHVEHDRDRSSRRRPRWAAPAGRRAAGPSPSGRTVAIRRVQSATTCLTPASVRIATVASAGASCCRSSAPSARTPLPDTSARLPSALSSRMRTSSRRRLVHDEAVGADAGCGDRTSRAPARPSARLRRPRPSRTGSRCRRRGLWRTSTPSNEGQHHGHSLHRSTFSTGGEAPLLLPAERQQVPPERAHHPARQDVEGADEHAVVDRALPAAVQARLHRETLGHDADLAKAAREAA